MAKKCEIFTAMIFHVEKDGRTFHLVREENLKKEIQLIRNSIKNNLSMINTPAINQKFIVDFEEICLRAIRLEDNQMQIQNAEDKIKFYLLDTGETIIASVINQKLKFYNMPNEIVNIEPLAFKVKWTGNNFNDEYQSPFSYRIYTFEILQSEPEIIVNIWPYDTNNDGDDEFAIKESSDEEIQKNDDDLNQISNVNCNEVSDDEEIEISGIKTTKKQWNQFMEDPFNTNNASIAVQGYITNDDKEMCKFYDPKTGACFKGVNCTKVHLPELKDGFETRDKGEIFYNGPRELELPIFGKSYDIILTHFISPNRFMCIYVKNFDKAWQLEKDMNSEEAIRSYEKLTNDPVYLELVVYENNGKFQRARVLQTSDIHKRFLIYLFDVGITLQTTLDKLYKWRTRFQFTDQLSTEMIIGNIKPIGTKIKEAIREIIKLQQQDRSYFKAFIIGYFDSLVCRLFDSNGNEISEILINRELVERKDIERLQALNELQCIPG
ncbi:hypothetical protein PVAND_014309 [Polypedilum vanderplanki]|uniref:C3H1-type domain-containing protein n=1 Tax=Polypedilum vanderplanki TaxID=319348 RepID=A0A9J6CSZ3_POLVA|nr:hypothetical protein PVAND_014309 [Polypedilum vanderplanki]